MFFEYPELLWLMIVPALLVLHYIYLELAERHPHLRVSTAVPWLAKSTGFKSSLRHIPFILRTIALCLIVVAIARPRSSEDMEKIDTEGIDIVLAMDVSTSMLARDLTPDRINASKDIAIEFISQRPSDRMGIVVFAGESFTQCPLTTDRATLINLIAGRRTAQCQVSCKSCRLSLISKIKLLFKLNLFATGQMCDSARNRSVIA